MPDPNPKNSFAAFSESIVSMIDGPVTWFREKVVEPNRKQYPWYHQQFRRVPTIDQCYTDDYVCIFEADQQWKRDKMVDNEILSILRARFEDCVLYEAPDHMTKCLSFKEAYEKGAENWFTKYGDLGATGKARECYMKQKHRLIWERRHGKVGSGMKEAKTAVAEEE